MNKLDSQYSDLIKLILDEGEVRNDRTGVGTTGIFGHQMRFKMDDGFPLLTNRKIHTTSLIHELLWFLESYDDKYKKFGNTNVKYLCQNGVSFWNEWVYEEYKKKMLEKWSNNDLKDEKTVKPLKMLSPGERGVLLLVFYLLIDQGNEPLIIDQPEGNLTYYITAADEINLVNLPAAGVLRVYVAPYDVGGDDPGSLFFGITLVLLLFAVILILFITGVRGHV